MDTPGKASPSGVPSAALRPPGCWASWACRKDRRDSGPHLLLSLAPPRSPPAQPSLRLPHVLLGQGLGRGRTPAGPEVMTAHLISTIQGLLRATGRTNSKFRFRGERPKESTHVNHGEARQVKGHTQEDWATFSPVRIQETPLRRVLRVKHQSVEARGFLRLLLRQQTVRLQCAQWPPHTAPIWSPQASQGPAGPGSSDHPPSSLSREAPEDSWRGQGQRRREWAGRGPSWGCRPASQEHNRGPPAIRGRTGTRWGEPRTEPLGHFGRVRKANGFEAGIF